MLRLGRYFRFRQPLFAFIAVQIEAVGALEQVCTLSLGFSVLVVHHLLKIETLACGARLHDHLDVRDLVVAGKTALVVRVEILVRHQGMPLAQVVPLFGGARLLAGGIQHAQLLDDVRDRCLLQHVVVALRSALLGCVRLQAANQHTLREESVDVQPQ
uniref:Uncharacterized protein n=1 Tax=Favella ehrenbergii TaxID=182087 RepID=A0A7S3HVE1_9SPIT